ncbi:MAG: type II secretion system F family protein [Actinomycetota bacterium]
MILFLIMLYVLMCFCMWMAVPKGKNPGTGVSLPKKSLLKRISHIMARLGRVFPNLPKRRQKGQVFPVKNTHIGWESFYGYKMLCALLFAAGAVVVANTFIVGIIFGAAGFAAGFWVPDLLLGMEIRKRNKSILADLPYILDLLYISTLSGQNIYRSMEILVQNYEGEICRQFDEFIQNIRFGRGKDSAYQILSRKPNPEQFQDILNMLQVTENCGANISGILKQKSRQLKFEITQEVERKSRKVSLMILFPLAFLILPSFVLLVGGPLIFTIGGEFIIF